MGGYRGGYGDFDVGDASKGFSRNATEKKMVKRHLGRCSGCPLVTLDLTFPRVLSTSRPRRPFVYSAFDTTVDELLSPFSPLQSHGEMGQGWSPVVPSAADSDLLNISKPTSPA